MKLVNGMPKLLEIKLFGILIILYFFKKITKVF